MQENYLMYDIAMKKVLIASKRQSNEIKNVLGKLGEQNPYTNMMCKSVWGGILELHKHVKNAQHDLGYKDSESIFSEELLWDCVEELNTNVEYRTESEEKSKRGIGLISELFVEHDNKIYKEIMP